MTEPLLSVVIPSFQGRHVLPDTLRSIELRVPEPREIVVVDDGSTDGTPELVRAQHPAVRVIERGVNSGRRLNVVRNQGIAAARAARVLLVDDDIELAPGCVEALLAAMHEHGAAICTPRVRDRDAPEVIYADGGGLHFLGLSVVGGRGETLAQRPVFPPCPTFGGGIMLLDRATVLAHGGFDEAMPMGWGDDGELHLRLRMRGLPVLHVPAASCFHLERSHGVRRARGQIENRWRVMLEAWSLRTALALAPLYLAFELALLAGAVVAGLFGAWREALAAVWRDRERILARRRELQRLRVVGDGVLLSAGVPSLPRVVRRSPVLGALTRAAAWPLDAVWSLARRLDARGADAPGLASERA